MIPPSFLLSLPSSPNRIRLFFASRDRFCHVGAPLSVMSGALIPPTPSFGVPGVVGRTRACGEGRDSYDPPPRKA